MFGRLVSGHDLVDRIQSLPTDETDRPLEPVVVTNSGELIKVAKSSKKEHKKDKKKSKNEKKSKKSKKKKKSRTHSGSDSSSMSDDEEDGRVSEPKEARLELSEPEIAEMEVPDFGEHKSYLDRGIYTLPSLYQLCFTWLTLLKLQGGAPPRRAFGSTFTRSEGASDFDGRKVKGRGALVCLFFK